LISTITFFISKIEFFPFKKKIAIQNQFLISRIDFLLVEIPISQIRNTIITSKNLYFWYQEFNCY